MFPFACWKAGGFDPKSVAGLRVWYDATSCTIAAGKVTALPDKSGASRNASITGTPAYSATNAAYNNRPTIHRADASDIIQSPDVGITTGARTLVLVGDVPSGDPFAFLLRSTAGGVDMRDDASHVLAGSDDGGATLLLDTGVRALTSASVSIIVYNGASSRLYATAKTAVSGTTGSLADLTGSGFAVGDVGANGGGDINFTHALVYAGALSTTDINYLLTGFGAQCGITIGP
jgi:hypothetical protein